MKSAWQAASEWARVLSWVALALADLLVLPLLFPPSLTRNKDPDLSGGFALNQSSGVGILLLVSAAARLFAPAGDSRIERRVYWVLFGVTVLLWLASMPRLWSA
jgi:hypothetical protein